MHSIKFGKNRYKGSDIYACNSSGARITPREKTSEARTDAEGIAAEDPSQQKKLIL